jgi:cell division protease FtsH
MQLNMATEEQKKKPLQRRLNSNLTPGTPEEDPKKKPKLSIYWVYGIIFAVIIGYNLFRTTTSTGVQINDTDCYAMLSKEDVDQIKTVGNKKLVRVFIDPQKMQEDAGYFQNVFGQNYDEVKRIKDAPQAYFTIIKDEVFATQLN